MSIKSISKLTLLLCAQSSMPRTLGCFISGNCCLKAIRVMVEGLTEIENRLDRMLRSFPVSSIDKESSTYDGLAVLLAYRIK